MHVPYAIDEGRMQVLFTRDAFIYCLDKLEKTSDHERKPGESGPEHEIRLRMQKVRLKVTTETVCIKWENANPNVQIIPLDLAQDYFNYTVNVNGELKPINYIKGYKKLLYKNIYPNIDLEYTIHPNKGFKYSFILHPGANPNYIQMVVESSTSLIIDASGNVHYPTMYGDIIDEVLDMKGQKVYTKAPQNIIQDNVVEMLNLGHLSKGMYLIIARTSEKVYAQKVVVK
ncbi:MAG: T9SS type A sorting domain-containing protein [Bacteroidia bacterium]|nr:T9SS type A sorting domain-containing protein [Bacteroidia bacterium]MDW8348374.1 T9SS type A sorting domain-containing protein [Bacteroidia bacterium]